MGGRLNNTTVLFNVLTFVLLHIFLIFFPFIFYLFFLSLEFAMFTIMQRLAHRKFVQELRK